MNQSIVAQVEEHPGVTIRMRPVPIATLKAGTGSDKGHEK
jgi:hypothetical protein